MVAKMALPSTKLLVTLLLWLAPNVSGQSGSGIIGFGISFYQDLCCQACYDSLSALYLTCTTFSSDGGDDMSGMDMRKKVKRDDGGDMGPMGMTSDDCRANNTAWLQTMAYCIQQNCDADGYPVDQQAACFSNHAVAGASTPTFRDSLPASPPTVELAADAVWLNDTSLVNSDVYYQTHGTEGEFARSEYMHTRYSVALYFVVIGICLACGLLAQITSLSPGLQRRLLASKLWSRLRQHIFLPALFGSRRLEPLPGRTGYVPGRALSVFIAVYIILNVIFSSVSFGSFQPNIYFFSQQFELCEYVGNRTGTLSLVNMSIAILFAGRNNLLIALTGWNQTTFLTLHRWTARMAAVQAVVHSIVYTLAYFEPGYAGASAYAAKAAEPFYWWGIIATIAMCLAAGLAFLPFRARFYEPFLLLHIAFVILTLIGCWYHLVPHFTLVYGYQVWLYICFAFWGAEWFARLVRVALYNPLGGSKAVVEAIPGCDNILQITVFPRAVWGFGPAQHSFLHFPGLQGRFWESHPFSVAGWTTPGQPSLPAAPASAESVQAFDSEAKETNTTTQQARAVSPTPTPATQSQSHGPASIRFLTRAHSGITSTLRNRLLSSPSGSALETRVYTQGPYAGHRATLHPLLTADTVLCLAGGIGITHMLALVQQYVQTQGRRERGEGDGLRHGTSRKQMAAKRFILAWSARERGLIEHVRREFLTGVEGVEVLVWCTGEGSSTVEKEDGPVEGEVSGEAVQGKEVKAGRMNIEAVLRAAAEPGQQTAVLVCAPGAMADEVTRQVVRCVGDGLRVELVEEAFAW